MTAKRQSTHCTVPLLSSEALTLAIMLISHNHTMGPSPPLASVLNRCGQGRIHDDHLLRIQVCLWECNISTRATSDPAHLSSQTT